MSTPTNIVKQWVKDSTTIVINETDLTEKKVGEGFRTPERTVAHPGGLKWWIRWYAAGDSKLPEDHISLYLWVNKAVSAKYNFKVERSTIQFSSAFDFPCSRGHGEYNFASHEALRPLFVNGQLNITCSVEFELPLWLAIQPSHLLHFCRHLQPNFIFNVGSGRINTYKQILSLLSPKLHKIVSETTETDIKDFDYNTVKAAIDYCCGMTIKYFSVETIIGILRFGGHYEIEAITKGLVVKIEWFLSADTVCIIAHYADDTKNQSVFEKCCEFLKNNIKIIRTKESFTKLTPEFATRMFKTALKTDFDTFRYALFYALNFIVNYLEPSVSKSVSLTNFCPLVTLAINYKRESLKKECGKFYTDNQDELRRLDPFISLSLDKNILITKEWITDLPVSLVVHLLKTTLKMESEFDVLDYAYNNGFEFDWICFDELERPLLESVTLDNFCAAAGYAWSCSRGGLKQVCGKFYIVNLEKIMKLKAITKLPAETTHELLTFYNQLFNNELE
uniref:BTB domain-containing protein n=1 Tax=Panagrellus redivivus TaxID=6233 RepID=A0A7E4UNE3_PANRE